MKFAFSIKVTHPKTRRITPDKFQKLNKNQREIDEGKSFSTGGAAVNRSSLEKAKAADNSSSFDILPDKIIVYLPSSSLLTKFEFKFRQHYDINTRRNALSIIEAQATVALLKFQ